MRSVEECLHEAINESDDWQTVRQLRIRIGRIRAEQYFSNGKMLAQDTPFIPSDTQTRREIKRLVELRIIIANKRKGTNVYRTKANHPAKKRPPPGQRPRRTCPRKPPSTWS